MSQKNKQIWWWILTFSFVLIWFIWLIVSFIFRIISTSSVSWDVYVIKSFINWILWLLVFLSFVPWLPLWIIWLVQWYKSHEYDRNIKLKTDSFDLQNIYQEDFDASNLTKTDIDKILKHGLKKKFSPGLAVFLNIITIGIFWFFYYWFSMTIYQQSNPMISVHERRYDICLYHFSIYIGNLYFGWN